MMERLTERHYKVSDGAYLKCSEECTTLCCDDCDKLDNIVDRLAAYEDTGLEPEDINDFVDSYKTMRDNEEARVRLMCGTGVILPERAAEITKAEQEGRLVVLPCKVGTIVWVITTSYTYGEVGDPPEARRRIDRRIFTLPMFYSYGKTVFLTREEAEAKLKEVESDG